MKQKLCCDFVGLALANRLLCLPFGGNRGNDCEMSVSLCLHERFTVHALNKGISENVIVRQWGSGLMVLRGSGLLGGGWQQLEAGRGEGCR